MGGANLRYGRFLVKTSAKMKESDPVGGGAHAGDAPRSANKIDRNMKIIKIKIKMLSERFSLPNVYDVIPLSDVREICLNTLFANNNLFL